MRGTVSTTIALLAAFSCILSAAYEIAFTDEDVEHDGYEYNFAFLSRASGERCYEIDNIDLDFGPREVLVRAKAGYTPVPKYIAFYSNASPQIGKCNDHSLLEIIAFDPTIFDRQQMQKISALNVRYWKEINYNIGYPISNYASALISKFRPRAGEFLTRNPANMAWVYRESPLGLFEWNETPPFAELHEAPSADSKFYKRRRPMSPKRARISPARQAAWTKSAKIDLEDSSIGPKHNDLMSILTESDGRLLPDSLLDQYEGYGQRFLLRLPDTPLGMGHGLEISDLASISPPLGRVESIPEDLSEISVPQFRDPFEEFVDSLGSLPETLDINTAPQIRNEPVDAHRYMNEDDGFARNSQGLGNYAPPQPNAMDGGNPISSSVAYLLPSSGGPVISDSPDILFYHPSDLFDDIRGFDALDLNFDAPSENSQSHRN
ncbi:hypothetical protein TWF730_010504 [Orbilia blumenaviensis]|uniref:Uncharacterized protein n=1 Tax=Orbilia blumenaviensis TaxID=1796055 RepID=A0AAV9UP98_9PEZI